MSRGRHRARHVGRQQQPSPRQPASTAASHSAPPLVQSPVPQPVSAQPAQNALTSAGALGQGTRSAAAPDTGSPAARARRKDQERALTAYQWANAAREAALIQEYETAVQGFAAALLRSGFAVAVSMLERNKQRKESQLLLQHLAGWPLPGIEGSPAGEWPQRVRALADVGQYMQATREILALLGWLRRAGRAVQAEGQ